MRTGGLREVAKFTPDLMEWDYGDYEGRLTADIRRERPGWYLFRDGCPGGESLAAVGDRADRVIARLRADGGASSSSATAISPESSPHDGWA